MKNNIIYERKDDNIEYIYYKDADTFWMEWFALFVMEKRIYIMRASIFVSCRILPIQ